MIAPRVKSIVVIRHEDKFLFTSCADPSDGKPFYIPVGGGVEFGESSADAAIREVLEETGIALDNPQLLQVVENIFNYDGAQGHEIVFIYSAAINSEDINSQNFQAGLNDDGKEIKLVWVTLQEIIQNNIIVYPEQLLSVLQDISLTPN